MYNAGVLNFSKKTSAHFCLFAYGFKGASVNKTYAIQQLQQN